MLRSQQGLTARSARAVRAACAVGKIRLPAGRDPAALRLLGNFLGATPVSQHCQVAAHASAGQEILCRGMHVLAALATVVEAVEHNRACMKAAQQSMQAAGEPRYAVLKGAVVSSHACCVIGCHRAAVDGGSVVGVKVRGGRGARQLSGCARMFSINRFIMVAQLYRGRLAGCSHSTQRPAQPWCVAPRLILQRWPSNVRVNSVESARVNTVESALRLMRVA
eukprot:jgi/Ulvmu1/6626/UM003_0264.1